MEQYGYICKRCGRGPFPSIGPVLGLCSSCERIERNERWEKKIQEEIQKETKKIQESMQLNILKCLICGKPNGHETWCSKSPLWK